MDHPPTSIMMSSPTTSAGSQLSTPSITVTTTTDNGRSTSLVLPDPLVERPKSLMFEVPLTIASGRVRPSTERARTSAGNGNMASNGPKPSDSLVPPQSNPVLKRSSSLRLLTDLRKSISSGNLRLHHRDRDKSPHDTNNSEMVLRRKHSTESPLETQTPEVRQLFQQTTCPDLDAIDRALASLRNLATKEDDPFVRNLTILAGEIGESRMSGKKKLTTAMKQRDLGNIERCRGLCLEIVKNAHSDIDTKVYAYNILSTQASPGQALPYLNEAWNLVKKHEDKRPDSDKLYSTIALLKERAIAKDANTDAVFANSQLDFASEEDLSRIRRAGTAPRPAMVRDLLMLPQAKKENVRVADGDVSPFCLSGANTPRTEKIMSWAEVEDRLLEVSDERVDSTD